MRQYAHPSRRATSVGSWDVRQICGRQRGRSLYPDGLGVRLRSTFFPYSSRGSAAPRVEKQHAVSPQGGTHAGLALPLHAPRRRSRRMSNQLTVNLGLILLVASVVAMASRRMRLPYSVGLVAAGVLLALTPINIAIPLSPDSIFTVLLPPLIFEAALSIRWPPFRRDLPVILILAFMVVAMSAALVTVGLHILISWGWLGAAMFGVLIAATDPVSVIAAFKEMKVEPRLSLLVEAESLLNDGAAAVGFTVLVAIASGSAVDPTAITGLLLWKVLGGVIVGGGLTCGLLLIAGAQTITWSRLH
jgi:NhaP-type Na+/H+ or K+/H+ antiporter